MRWPWRRNGSEERAQRAEAEARLRAAKRQAPMVEYAADRIAEMSTDEFAALVAEAFSRRSA